MLPIPIKNSTAVGLAAPLKIYVANEYSKEEADAVDSDLKALERMRTMALQARAATDASITTLQAYYSQVERLQGLFPVNPEGVRILFTWHDAFRPTKKGTEIDLNFEKAGILFNIGAVKSHIAASADRTTPDGVKLACREFQLAAGVFKLLREGVVSHMTCALPSDMSQDGLLMVENIMLAQAQACFYEKAVADRLRSTSMKASIIARLACQAAEMYGTALRHAESQSMDAGGLDKSWAITLRFQQEFYTAAAQYYQSEAVKEAALETGSGYGEEITRLKVAQKYIEGVIETANRQRMGPAIISKAELLKAKIVKNKTTAEKDNSTIYLEGIPPDSSLKAIGKACMVKVIEVEFPPPTQVLLATLLPKPVKEALTSYQKDASALISAADQDSKDASKDARKQLCSVGLPGSLESHESPGGLPEATWKKIQGLREKQSTIPELQSQAADLQTAAGNVAEVFLKIEKTLREEEERDTGFRKKYGEAWDKVGVASSKLMDETWKEVAHFQTLFAEAQKSDAYLMSRINGPDIDTLAALLASSRHELDAQLARPDRSPTAPPVDTKALSKAMLELASVLQERDAIIQNMKTQQETLTEKLKTRLLTGAEAQAGISECMQPMEDLKGQVKASLEKQGPILAKILQENKKFQASRQADPATLQRDQLIQQLETGVVKCHELHAQLTEGKEFYASVSKRIKQLLLVTEDMVYTQDIQRKEFEVVMGQSAHRQQQENEDSEAARKLFDQLNMQAQQDLPPGQAPQAPSPYPQQQQQGPPPAYYGGQQYQPPQAPPAPAGPYSQNPFHATGVPTLYTPQGQPSHQARPPPPHYPGNQPPQQPQYYAPLPASLSAMQYHGHQSQHQQQQHPPGPPPSYSQAARPMHSPPPMSGGAQISADERKVRQLVEMGFPEQQVRQVLAANRGDVQAALSQLLQR